MSRRGYVSYPHLPSDPVKRAIRQQLRFEQPRAPRRPFKRGDQQPKPKRTTSWAGAIVLAVVILLGQALWGALGNAVGSTPATTTTTHTIPCNLRIPNGYRGDLSDWLEECQGR
jgi:cytoskeletal protein RodZ